LFFALLELVSYIKEVLTETKDIMKNYFWWRLWFFGCAMKHSDYYKIDQFRLLFVQVSLKIV
jgi:hypothetical protein